MLTKRDAALEIARHHAQRIVSGTVSPYDGAKAIVWEAYHESDLQELTVFAGLESEHADFSDETRTEYYGEKHCEGVRDDIEARIREEARKFVADDA